MTSNKMMTTNTHDIPREPRLLTHGLRFTQEQLKNMYGKEAPEFVELNDVLYYCPYRTMFGVWHKTGENPNYPEWNYINTCPLKYIVYTGNRKPTKEEIVSMDDLFKYLKDNNYYSSVRFDTGEGAIHLYRRNKRTDEYDLYRTYRIW